MKKSHNKYLTGSKLQLRPFKEQDLDQMYDWFTDFRIFHLWAGERKVVTQLQFEEDFKQKLRRHIDTLFVVQKMDGTPIGFIYSYNTSLIDRHASYVIFIEYDYIGKGYGVEASMIFIRYLFDTYGLRKIYTEVFDFNTLSLKTLLSAGFESEATLKEYRYHEGKFRDLQILSLSRQQFDAFYHKMASSTTE